MCSRGDITAVRGVRGRRRKPRRPVNKLYIHSEKRDLHLNSLIILVRGKGKEDLRVIPEVNLRDIITDQKSVLA